MKYTQTTKIINKAQNSQLHKLKQSPLTQYKTTIFKDGRHKMSYRGKN